MDTGWYIRRLRAMSPGEVARRVRDETWHQAFRIRRDAIVAPLAVSDGRPPPLPEDGGAAPDARFVDALVAAAEAILAGHWVALGVERSDLVPEPDWFWDPETGVRSDPDRYSFDVNPRDPSQTGNVKNVWELSRHHHVTVLAAAYFLSGRTEFAEAAADQLRSWWRRNPFLHGVNWTSGIELGIRLISWTWTRRLLDGWPGAAALFEDSPEFRDQLYQHQVYLERFVSHDSSANNHLIAELAGQFVASCAFALFPESSRWRRAAAQGLLAEAEAQTFPSGLNRELASDYHGFVLELLLAAATEGETCGHPIGPGIWDVIIRMADAGAAFVDADGREPRQGDGDQGVALQLDGGHRPRWRSLLPTLQRLVGRCSWWPEVDETDVRTALWTAGIVVSHQASRPAARPNLFPDAGMVLLRDPTPGQEEIWCRCDGGPFGFLSIAGHAHADALSVEVRFGGVDVLADPGTYCYHVSPEWRSYFRSTRAHNTIEVDGVDQAEQSGPFNWRRHADAETLHVAGLDGGPVASWTGRHHGYERLDPPVGHTRSVVLDRHERRLTVTDRLSGGGARPVRLSFHLGPTIACSLETAGALLTWRDGTRERSAALHLPPQLTWREARGVESPAGGWYSEHMGSRLAAVALMGVGELHDSMVLESVLEFHRG